MGCRWDGLAVVERCMVTLRWDHTGTAHTGTARTHTIRTRTTRTRTTRTRITRTRIIRTILTHLTTTGRRQHRPRHHRVSVNSSVFSTCGMRDRTPPGTRVRVIAAGIATTAMPVGRGVWTISGPALEKSVPVASNAPCMSALRFLQRFLHPQLHRRPHPQHRHRLDPRRRHHRRRHHQSRRSIRSPSCHACKHA